jgi:site-specific DNA recombinase
VTGPDGRKTIEPDPDYAPLVAKLFEWYATGRYSLSELTRKAAEAGFVFRKSKRPVSRAAVHTLLRNRMFTGRFVWKGKNYQGNYPPSVSEESWERVRTVVAERNRCKTQPARKAFAFSRSVACGHRGCALVGEIKKGKYVYYHCTGYKQKCREPFVRKKSWKKDLPPCRAPSNWTTRSSP